MQVSIALSLSIAFRLYLNIGPQEPPCTDLEDCLDLAIRKGKASGEPSRPRVIGRSCPPSLCILRSYLSAGYACCVPGFWVLSQPSLVVHFSRIIARGIYWRVARFRSLLAPSVASCILSIILHIMQVFNVDFFYNVRFVFGQRLLRAVDIFHFSLRFPVLNPSFRKIPHFSLPFLHKKHYLLAYLRFYL